MEGVGWLSKWLDRWQEAGAKRLIDFRELAAAVGYDVHYVERQNKPDDCYDPDSNTMTVNPHYALYYLESVLLRVGRDQVQQALHRQNIGTGIHYRALHLHRYYREAFGYTRGDLPNAEWISDRTLSLPLSPKLTDVDVDDVIFAVRQTLRHFVR
jgi:UDP-4-amino-4-deoxy-L-arabinose-oxoglutarate aminotransferase